MSDLNRWEGIGRLGADIELRYLPNGNAVANFNIAVDDSYKNKAGEKVEQTEWVRCSAFDKTAEYLAKWLLKGKRVLVVGKLKTREYEKDGIKRYSTEIHIQQGTQIIDWPERDQQRAATPASARQAPAARPQTSQQAAPPDYDSFDDDIPFIDPYRGNRCLII